MPKRVGARGLVFAIVVPLVAVGFTYMTWWISDRLLYIGPFDRATVAWGVVIPVWLATPLIAALAWQRLERRESTIAAVIVAVVIGGAAAVLLWQATAFPDCQIGPNHGPEAWVIPALGSGALIGGGLAASATLASRYIAANRRFVAIASALGMQVGFMFAALFLFTFAILLMPGCARPS